MAKGRRHKIYQPIYERHSMKTLALALLVTVVSLPAQAEEVRSEKTQVNMGRVVELQKLVQTNDIRVNVTVEDLGGSTDVSPTQQVYLTLYAKGEMFSTDAVFKIAPAFDFVGAKRVSGGVYEITVVDYLADQGMKNVTYVVDARRAIVEIKNVRCEDFDCDASNNFASSVSVTRK